MFENFTDNARKVLALANQEAQRLNHNYIGTEHVLLGLAKVGGTGGAILKEGYNLGLGKIKLEVEKLAKPGPEIVYMGKLPQTPRAKRVIEYAIDYAKRAGHDHVGSEHILFGLAREFDGIAAEVLRGFGAGFEDLEGKIDQFLQRKHH